MSRLIRISTVCLVRIQLTIRIYPTLPIFYLSTGSLEHYLYVFIRVKSGNFGHQVNLDIPLQTVEIQMRRLLQDFHCLLSLSIFLFQYEGHLESS